MGVYVLRSICAVVSLSAFLSLSCLEWLRVVFRFSRACVALCHGFCPVCRGHWQFGKLPGKIYSCPRGGLAARHLRISNIQPPVAGQQAATCRWRISNERKDALTSSSDWPNLVASGLDAATWRCSGLVKRTHLTNGTVKTS